ncbi:MAG: hypothetical protein AAB661_00420, partial [Patescibacteria group bacterium]
MKNQYIYKSFSGKIILIAILLVTFASLSFAIQVNAAETLLSTCWIHDYSNESNVYGINGATFSFSGTCTPPTGTTRINMNINYDDAGSVRINGVTVDANGDNACRIQNYDINVTGRMNIGT